MLQQIIRRRHKDAALNHINAGNTNHFKVPNAVTEPYLPNSIAFYMATVYF
ncbi:hypothetical protein GJ744_008658 [Endocarpon pusillum]|uniref:Uncharacterized protein n=1 Tax=Endocarpon pusillum TaxID=364733 RepID=A0A8H7E6M1_9EURO|nr:hypothetical protein GJ744_008658 [Endocarpon pusillum]